MQKLVGAEPKKAVIIALLMEGNYHPSDVARMCRVSEKYVMNIRTMLGLKKVGTKWLKKVGTKS